MRDTLVERGQVDKMRKQFDAANVLSDQQAEQLVAVAIEARKTAFANNLDLADLSKREYEFDTPFAPLLSDDQARRYLQAAEKFENSLSNWAGATLSPTQTELFHKLQEFRLLTVRGNIDSVRRRVGKAGSL